MNLSLWTRVCQVKNWDKDDRQLRLDFFSSVLRRPLTSSSQIGKMDDFTELKAACLAIIDPTNLEAQLAQAEMPRTNRIFKCRELAPEAYIVAEAKRKFGTDDWEDLSEPDLTQLRNHLAARAGRIQWPRCDDPDWSVS